MPLPGATGSQRRLVDHRRVGLGRERERRRRRAVARRDRDRLRRRLRRADPFDDREHRRQRGHQRVLHVARQDAAARAEQAQRREVPPAGLRRERVQHRPCARVAHEVARVDVLAFEQVEHELHVDVRLAVEHDLAAAEQRAERRPLPARVHQRPERERHELRDRRVARRKERPESLRGVVEHRCRDLLGRGDRRASRVAAAEAAEEHVLLAPHHALRPAGRAAGVEHVVVVGGAWAEVAFGRSRPHEPLVVVGAGDDGEQERGGARPRRRARSCRRRGTSATRSASSHK